jgi:peptide/nickel transport system permease protein
MDWLRKPALKIAQTFERMRKHKLYLIIAWLLGFATLLVVKVFEHTGTGGESVKQRDILRSKLKEDGVFDALKATAKSQILREREFFNKSVPDEGKLNRLAQADAQSALEEKIDYILEKENPDFNTANAFQEVFARLLSKPLFFIFSIILSLPMYIVMGIFSVPYLKYTFERALMLVFVVVGVIALVFSILYISPSKPAENILGQGATQEQINNFNKIHGLDKPYIEQGFRYVKNILTFDLGRSYIGNENISEAIGRRFSVTLQIALLSMLFCLILALPSGIISAIKQYSAYDYVFMFIALVGLSIPSFWLGLIMVLNFSLKARWLPAMYQADNWVSMLMPAIVLSTVLAAGIARMTRSSVLEVKRSDYIMTARAKGLSENAVILRHILPNAMIPIVTVIGLQFGSVLGGAATVEKVFNIMGIGAYVVDKQYLPDVPAVIATVVYASLVVSVANLAVDILYTLIDPRLKTRLKNY